MSITSFMSMINARPLSSDFRRAQIVPSFVIPVPTIRPSRTTRHWVDVLLRKSFSIFCVQGGAFLVFAGGLRQTTLGRHLCWLRARPFDLLCSYNTGIFPGFRLLRLFALVLAEDGFAAEIADQVKTCSKGYNILEKEEAQETHVPHPVNGNSCTGGRYHHGAGYQEHERSDKSAYDTGFGLKMACDHQERSNDLGEPDNVGTDVRTEQFEVPPNQRAVRNQGNDAFGSWSGHLISSGPEQHHNHADADDSEREINIICPFSQFG